MRTQHRDGAAAAVASPPGETTPLLRAGPAGDTDQEDAPKIIITPATQRSEGGDGDGEGEAGNTVSSEGNPELLKRMPIITAAIGIGVYLGAMEQLLAATIYPKIGSDLNSLNNTSWIATAYFLTLTSFQPLYGKLSDIFGRKECLLFAYAIFGLGCLGCGLARDMAQLCVARAVAGIGGAGMAPVTSILISDIVPLRDRGLWQGYINIIFGVGCATGAPLGGWLTDSVGWRWAFVGQVPICAVAFTAVYLVIPATVHPAAHTLLAKLRRVDFLGSVTLIVAIVSLLAALDSGANRSWTSLRTLGSLAVSLPSFALFALVETRFASDPFAPPRVVLHPPVLATNIMAALCQGASTACLFLLPMFYQAVLGYSPSAAGALFVPSTMVLVVSAVGSGLIMRRTGRFKTLIHVALSIIVVAMVPLAISVARESVVGTVTSMAVASVGNSTTLTAVVVALLALMPDAGDTATVVACQYLFRSLGNSVSMAISAAVLQGTLRQRLAIRLGGSGSGNEEEARRIEERVRRSLDYIKELSPATARLVRLSYRDATLAALIPIAMFAIGALVASLFIKNKMIRR